MAKVIELSGVTSLDIPAERVLRKALETGMEKVVILGFTEDGMEYFASSVSDGGDVLWLLKRCEIELMKAGEFSYDK